MMFLGVPAILQADNGKEFKGAVLKLVTNHGVKVKNGRARTPHVQGMCPSLLFIQLPVNGSWHIQGLVEQGNHSVKDSIRARKAESGYKDWNAALPEICWSPAQCH